MIKYEFDKNTIKQSLTLEDMMEILSELGAEPQPGFGEVIYCRTICHGGDSSKLWYWDNTKLFKCFTKCSDSFDIFELVRKVKSQEENREWPLPRAVEYVADFFGISGSEVIIDSNRIEDWDVLENYDRIKGINLEKKIVEYEEYDGRFLKNLPKVKLSNWENEGITQTAIQTFNIAYEPKAQCILIPHYDIDNRLIGIRQRTLIKEIANKYGKYRPFKLGKVMFKHPLSFNLYGLNINQDNIRRAKRAIVFEAEKSVLIYESIYGRENNIAVACCGSSFLDYQASLLMKLGVEEIVICMDHDFDDVNSEQAKSVIKNLKKIHKKYGDFVKISLVWDRDNLTRFKDSPVDRGKDIFEKLYKQRINLY